ncbi:MAG TPA: type I phosphomannose isomerase catalytic subunit [Candidatus Limnocylindria bacterium]|nr:type I phosphomannose isomerase catalytic subunit [Candidatus Limnocylindria bacterium]
MLYPLTFQPIFKERVWGGRKLAGLYGKALPEGKTIGESWEITDRPEGVSVIANGPLAGRDLRWLLEQHGAEVLGHPPAPGERFPWLVKLLDASDDLSLQVHPPAHKALLLGGEPKTEMWFIADAEPGAKIYTGLRRGVTRAEFERKTHDGTVEDCFHVHHVRSGDTMFLPSGRVHALGAGNIIFEIQQNSDTTYRVFDWNRVGLDGQPRELHLEQSFASIDFFDCEPPLVRAPFAVVAPGITARPVVRHGLFSIDHLKVAAGAATALQGEPGLTVVGVVAGTMGISGNGVTVQVGAGEFVLLPAALGGVEYRSDSSAELLRVTAGRAG